MTMNEYLLGVRRSPRLMGSMDEHDEVIKIFDCGC